jgi:hydroxymethylbilane synthase
LWQANTVARLIAERGGPPCEIVVIRTSGDESAGPPDPPALGSNIKGTFVKEIEDALLNGHVDLAVHSSKDLSAQFPAGLMIGAALPREDPRDALLLPAGEPITTIDELNARTNAPLRIGTSSVRREAQLGRLLSRATFVQIRGNIDTRLRKLDAGECDVLVLACAGLKRLGLEQRISFALPPGTCIPAPGQGIISIQVRENQRDVHRTVSAINDAEAFDALVAERAVVATLGGGCQMPLGAHARVTGAELSMIAVVVSPGGANVVRRHGSGPRTNARAIGEALAQSLIDDGALQILNR